MTQPPTPLSDQLLAVPDAKARGRLRVDYMKTAVA